MIELNNLCGGYGGKFFEEVLHGVNLSVPEGKITVIVGPNGCGKSTLLKTMVGILPKSSGKILIDGSDSTHDKSVLDGKYTTKPAQ